MLALNICVALLRQHICIILCFAGAPDVVDKISTLFSSDTSVAVLSVDHKKRMVNYLFFCHRWVTYNTGCGSNKTYSRQRELMSAF